MGKRGGKKRNRREYFNDNWQAIDDYRLYYMHYRYWLEDLVLSRFNWINLPDEVDERYLEYSLLYKRNFVLFKPWYTSGVLGMPGTPIGRNNASGNPKRMLCQGETGYKHRTTIGVDGIVIHDSLSRISKVYSLEMYARKLAKFDQTIMINLEAQKTPIIVTCEEQYKESLLSVIQEYNTGAPIIFGVDELSDLLADGAFKALKTDAPYIIDKAMVDKQKTIYEIFTSVGIDNSNQDKKERLVESETSANDDSITGSRLAFLKPRRQGCADYNKLFKPQKQLQCVYDHDNASINYNFLHNLPQQNGVDAGVL